MNCPQRYCGPLALSSATVSATIRAAASGSVCSQNRSTVQPACCSRSFVSRSRARFASIFARHHSACRFGQVACSGHPCQKQPSTNTATRARVNAMSARRRVPGIVQSTRYRSPIRCSADRSASSAGVSRRRVACMRRRTSSDDAPGRSARLLPLIGARRAPRYSRPRTGSSPSKANVRMLRA